MSISKALSGSEHPLKVKHARVAIIGTFHSRGAHSFWAVALRQPLQVSLEFLFLCFSFSLFLFGYYGANHLLRYCFNGEHHSKKVMALILCAENEKKNEVTSRKEKKFKWWKF